MRKIGSTNRPINSYYPKEVEIEVNDKVKLVKQVSCGSDHTLVVSQDGYLFSAGSNESGQLGIGIPGALR